MNHEAVYRTAPATPGLLNTGGFLVVVDLQGVERPTDFILTDPCINCMEPRFGNTNLGSVGIMSFFRTHKCNTACSALGLKKVTLARKVG